MKIKILEYLTQNKIAFLISLKKHTYIIPPNTWIPKPCHGIAPATHTGH